MALLVTSVAAQGAGAGPQATRCTVTGASTWTPPINASTIRATSVSVIGMLTCTGGGVQVGAMAGVLRSPKLACVAPPATTPEGRVFTVYWNTGKSSKVSLRVTTVNSSGRQTLAGRVVAGSLKGDKALLVIQAKPGVGRCTDASPLVSNTWTGTMTL